MKLHIDLFKELLAAIEDDPRFDGQTWITPDAEDNLGVIGVSSYSPKEISYHLNLLIEGGYVKGKTSIQEKMPMISRLTLKGHELLEPLSQKDVLAKTKTRLDGLKDFALTTLTDIARKELYRFLGIE